MDQHARAAPPKQAPAVAAVETFAGDELRVIEEIQLALASFRCDLAIARGVHPERRPRAALRRGLEALAVFGLSDEEIAAAVVAGLRKGQQVYGPLDIAGDPRVWSAQAIDEARDLAVYAVCEAMRRCGGLR